MPKYDPIYLLVKLVLRSFYDAKLKAEEKDFVADNNRKHANVIWINLAAILLVSFGLENATQETIGQIISALIAPVMVMGAAWFAISFGGIPQHLMNIAMDITFYMFLAFMISLSTMFVAVAFVVHPLIWPVLVLVYLAATLSCILYDTADGLKAGLDEAVLKHSRAAIRYYRKQGIQEEENQ